jgi:hypothetical protein
MLEFYLQMEVNVQSQAPEQNPNRYFITVLM